MTQRSANQIGIDGKRTIGSSQPLDESHSLPSDGHPKFSFVANGAVDFRIPTIQLVFEIYFDTLTIENALVWTEEDYEDSSY